MPDREEPRIFGQHYLDSQRACLLGLAQEELSRRNQNMLERSRAVLELHQERTDFRLSDLSGSSDKTHINGQTEFPALTILTETSHCRDIQTEERPILKGPAEDSTILTLQRTVRKADEAISRMQNYREMKAKLDEDYKNMVAVDETSSDDEGNDSCCSGDSDVLVEDSSCNVGGNLSATREQRKISKWSILTNWCEWTGPAVAFVARHKGPIIAMCGVSSLFSVVLLLSVWCHIDVDKCSSNRHIPCLYSTSGVGKSLSLSKLAPFLWICVANIRQYFE